MTVLSGKVAIVTGGGGGIGSATCARFAAAGTRVGVLDIDLDAAQKVVDGIKAEGGTAIAARVDITDLDLVKEAVGAVEGELGATDILVNNAGWDVFRPFLDTEPDLWRKLIDINLVGALNMHYAVLPGMVERGYGRVVNIASDAGRGGSSGEAVYGACKAGLIALSKSLAREHARQGITFNTVCPGPTETALLENFMAEAKNPEKLAQAFTRAVPMGRLGKAEDLPGAILFLASDDAAYVTGQVISVSGGLTMMG